MKNSIRKRAWFRALKGRRLNIIVAPCKYEETVRSNKWNQVFFGRYCPSDFGYIVWP